MSHLPNRVHGVECLGADGSRHRTATWGAVVTGTARPLAEPACTAR
ncbi:MAG TPA: hypothetical protein VFH84_11030 [Amycolatopsis sp.]|nr:hypothetical protein [Amycolatopsis sp.]